MTDQIISLLANHFGNVRQMKPTHHICFPLCLLTDNYAE